MSDPLIYIHYACAGLQYPLIQATCGADQPIAWRASKTLSPGTPYDKLQRLLLAHLLSKLVLSRQGVHQLAAVPWNS